MYNNTLGYGNVALGYMTMYSNIIGNYNTCVGG